MTSWRGQAPGSLCAEEVVNIVAVLRTLEEAGVRACSVVCWLRQGREKYSRCHRSVECSVALGDVEADAKV